MPRRFMAPTIIAKNGQLDGSSCPQSHECLAGAQQYERHSRRAASLPVLAQSADGPPNLPDLEPPA